LTGAAVAPILPTTTNGAQRYARLRTRLPGYLVTAVVGIFALVEVGTPVWMVVGNSFASQRQAALLNFFPHGRLNLSNYLAVVRQGAFLTGLRNTILVAVPTVVLVILLGSMAAWAIARSSARWSDLAYYALLGGIFVPPSVVTTIFVLRHLHLYGSYLGLILVYTGLFLSLVIFLFTGFCRAIPHELEEAARIDGANWVTVFARVVLPLMRPIIFTAGILLLVAVWNDFQYQFFLMGGTQTLTTSLYTFTESTSGQAAASLGGFTLPWNLIFADVVLTSVPLIVVFAFAQRRLTNNLLTGALNG
jgi:raffinose/stachyose/melibiose transport system permease protein